MTIASNRGFASGAVLDGDTAGGGLGGTYPNPTVDIAAAKIVVVEATGDLSAEVNLGALTTGMLKHSVAAGVSTPATATSGTDYAPGTAANATGLVKSTTTTGALTTAVEGTDYSGGTAALATGIVKSTTTTGALSIAAAGSDYQAPLTARTDYACPDDFRAVYVGRAVSIAGLTAGATMQVFFEDFGKATAANAAPPGWTIAAGSSGTFTSQVAGSRGGILQLSSGATAGSYVQAYTTTPVIDDVSTSKWYMAVRFTLVTAVDAETKLAAGLFNIAGNDTIHAGFFGQLNSGAAFNLQTDGVLDGTGTSLVTAPDTSTHVIEVYGDGAGAGTAKVYARLDGGAAVNTTLTSAPTDACYPFLLARNYHGAGTAAARTINFHDFLFACN